MWLTHKDAMSPEHVVIILHIVFVEQHIDLTKIKLKSIVYSLIVMVQLKPLEALYNVFYLWLRIWRNFFSTPPLWAPKDRRAEECPIWSHREGCRPLVSPKRLQVPIIFLFHNWKKSPTSSVGTSWLMHSFEVITSSKAGTWHKSTCQQPERFYDLTSHMWGREKQFNG